MDVLEVAVNISSDLPYQPYMLGGTTYSSLFKDFP